MNKLYRCYNIDWETDSQEVSLPESVIIQLGEVDQTISDRLADELSNHFGFLVNGFKYEKVKQPKP